MLCVSRRTEYMQVGFRPFYRPRSSLGLVGVQLYSFQDFGALDRRWGSVPRPATFTPGKDTLPIVQEVGWAPGSVWTGVKSRPHRDFEVMLLKIRNISCINLHFCSIIVFFLICTLLITICWSVTADILSRMSSVRWSDGGNKICSLDKLWYAENLTGISVWCFKRTIASTKLYKQ